MKILSSLSTLVIAAASLILMPNAAHAEVASGIAIAAPVAYAGIGILEVIVWMSLFIFIPIALLGMVFRLLGFKKSDKSGKWHWNAKQAFAHFIKYFIYNVSMVAIWFVILQSITGSSYIYSNYRRYNPPMDYCSQRYSSKCDRNYGINYNCADFNKGMFGEDCINSAQVINNSVSYDVLGPVIALSGTNLIILFIYIILWAIIGPYISYFMDKIRKKPIIRPTFWLHIRLIVWNVIVFIGVGLFINLCFYLK